MGVGVSWDRLAGAVAKMGAGGSVSSVGTGYWNTDNVRLINGRPLKPINFHSTENFISMIQSAIEKSEGNGVVGVNILYAITDYERQVKDSITAGAKYIISGAGLPLRLPEFAGNADVALIPIVSSPRVVNLICKRWKRAGHLPDAIILEGPKSGGHQGYTYDQCYQDEYQLENTTPKVLEACREWGNIPLIVAGGIWDKNDIDKYFDMGVSGVQIATRFIATDECDASDVFKRVIINSTQKDIRLLKSPFGCRPGIPPGIFRSLFPAFPIWSWQESLNDPPGPLYHKSGKRIQGLGVPEISKRVGENVRFGYLK